jgi:hypothetical protein
MVSAFGQKASALRIAVPAGSSRRQRGFSRQHEQSTGTSFAIAG